MFNWPDDIAEVEPATRGRAFSRLMESVGLLMFHWSQLEEALVEDIRRMRAEGGGVPSSIVRVRGSFSERLAEWRALLSLKSRRNPGLAEAVLESANKMERLRQKRNLVAHHFAGASLDGEPSILCSAAGTGASGDGARITQSELTGLIEEIVACAGQIKNIEAGHLPVAAKAAIESSH
jgi:hypothetical protein